MPFIIANARWIGGAFLLALFSSFGQTFFISIFGAEIRSEFALTHGGFGGLYMVATLASALTLPFLGRIVDVVPIGRVCLLIGAGLAAGAVAMALAPNVAVLVVAIYMLRLFGQGMMSHTALTAMGRWFTANRGRAVSYATVGHQAGEALLPTAMIAIAAITGWRGSWLAVAAVAALIATPLVWSLMRTERQPLADEVASRPAGTDRTRAEVLRDPMFWIVLTGVLVPPFTGTSIFFHQAYLIELNGWEPSIYYGSFAIMAVTTVIFALATGRLVDRFGALRLLPTFLFPLSGACLVLGLFSAEWAAVAFMVLLGTSYGMSSTLFGAVWPEMYGTKHLGAVRSVVSAMMVFLTAAGPGLTGYLIDTGIPFPTQLLFVAGYCVVAMVVLRISSVQLISRIETEPLWNQA